MQIYKCSINMLLVLIGLAFQVQAASDVNGNEASVVLQATPQWVNAVAGQSDHISSSSQAVQYMLVDTQIKVSDHSQQLYQHYRYGLNEISAVESNSDISIRFSPAYESLQFHHLKIIRGDKEINQLNKEKIKIVAAEDEKSNNIYSGNVDAIILLEDIRVGDIIDYSYSIVGANPVFDNRFSFLATLGWQVRVDNLSLRVLMPASRSLLFKSISTDATINVTKQSEHTEYKVELQNTQAIVEQQDTPRWFDPYPYIQFSEYQNWQQVAIWAEKLFKTEGSLSTELTKLVTKLRAMEQKQAIEKAIEIVQDQVRYLGLEFAENSHRPHHPNSVYKNRYGDCKDKSLLLTVLLNKLGVEAYPALVSSVKRATIDQYLPSPDVFNHAIVKMFWQDKEYWIDPTINYQGKSLESIYQPNYGKSLVVKNNQSQLTKLAITTQAPNAIAIKEKIMSVDYFSPIEWQIASRYQGLAAENKRFRLARDGIEKLARSYLNYYAKSYPKIREITQLKVEDNKQNNELVITEHYLVPGYWAIENGHAYFELFSDTISEYVQNPKTIQRTQPLSLGSPVTINHSIVLMLPEHVNFEAANYSQTYQDDYMVFSSRLSYDLRRLTLLNTYRTNDSYVPAKDSAQHLVLLKKIRNKLSYNSSITKVELDEGINEVKTLMKSLNKHLLNLKQQ